MSGRFLNVLSEPSLVALGWTLLVILWETLVAGALFAAWRALHPRAGARAQHAVAAGAFLAIMACAMATPSLLRWLPAQQSAVSVLSSAVFSERASTIDDAPSLAAAIGAAPRAIGISLDDLAAAAALCWIAGAFALFVRFGAGMLGVADMRRRAVRLTDGAFHHFASRLQADLGLSRPVALLASSDIDAPAVVGWWTPALIVPLDRLSGLSPGMIAGLCAHELAHVRRRDYLANVLQSAAETLLFFSPAVRWIGRCMRETREYCCDDEALRRCGDPGEYVRALAALAAHGGVPAHQPALGAAGPRLVARVRRLLAVEPAPRFTGARVLACVLALVVLAVSGTHLAVVSASRTSGYDAIRTRLGVPPYPPVPYGFAAEQEGSGVDMSALISTLDAPVQQVTIRNTGRMRITGVRFAAAVEQMPSRARRLVLPGPVRLFVSEMREASIEPGESVQMIPAVLEKDALHAIVEQAHGAHVQFMVAIAAVQYADGTAWRTALNPMATSANVALGLDQPVVSRLFLRAIRMADRWQTLADRWQTLADRWQTRMVSTLNPRAERPGMASIPRSLVSDRTGPPVNGSACRDDLDRTFSPGAGVAIRGERGRRARCVDGRWLETDR
jgi:beta-lactamase regulating signal transducer with metallopeptidase domain